MEEKKVNLKTKIAMVIDDGLFLEMACKMGEKFKEVLYYTPWECPYPTMNTGMVGYGMPNITKALSIWDRFDEVDIFIFPSIYFGPLAVHIENCGKRVWSSKNGEEIEIYRNKQKKHMIKLGLPVAPYQVVKGMAALRDYLKLHNNVYVKIDLWRGQFETFASPSYSVVEPILDEIEYKMGPLKYITEFLIEDRLKDKVEIGCDMYTVDGKFPSKSLIGIEIKDMGYVGEFRNYEDVPKEVTNFNTKMANTFKNYRYRGFFSTEIRVGKDHKDYMIDFTARAPSPPNELYQELYSNLAEIIWYGSEGVLIDPIPAKKWGVQAMMYSSWGENEFLPIKFPESIKKYVKLMNSVKINNLYYTVPQPKGCSVVGAVIGMGNTLEEAMKMLKENADQVKAHDLDIKINFMDQAKEQMKKTQEFGIKLFSEINIK